MMEYPMPVYLPMRSLLARPLSGGIIGFLIYKLGLSRGSVHKKARRIGPRRSGKAGPKQEGG